MIGARARGRGPLFVVFAATGWALSSGCALFTDLNSDPYHLADAGATEGDACAGDGGCSGAEVQCLSTANCLTAGTVCCLTATSFSSARTACVVPSACQGGASLQLCQATKECPAGETCMTETCTLSGTSFALQACTQISILCTPQ